MNTYHPILFSTQMVQALLEGRKTQTRRINKAIPDDFTYSHSVYKDDKACGKPEKYCKREAHMLNSTVNYDTMAIRCPYGEIGDIFWVRESTSITSKEDKAIFVYKTDFRETECIPSILKWRPSIHMPKEACRLFLKITDIKVERLQDISEEDAVAEGVTEPEGFKGYIDAGIQINGMQTANYLFNELWQSINGEESWNSNPWVWAITFERIEKPADFLTS